MKLLSRPSAAATALVALALLAVLSPGCSSRGEPPAGTTNAASTIICGFFPVNTADGKVEYEPEYFLLGAMNRKLKNFPDFAQYVGMDNVSTCAGARDYYNAYLRYMRMHPGFDNHQPIVPHAPLSSFIPAEARNQKPAQVAKVLNGTPSNLFPVVSIRYSVPPGTPFFDNSTDVQHGVTGPTSQACTGFLIAKNWIVTAAHCIRNIALQGGNSRIFNDTWLNAYDQWKIDWPDANGDVICPAGSLHFGQNALCPTSTEPPWLVSVVDQNYIGVINPQNLDAAHNRDNNPPHDVALIYIYDQFYDGHLPPVMTLPDGTSAALAISTADVNPNWTLTAYGYGPNNTPFPSLVPQLTSGALSSPVILEGTSAGIGMDVFDIGLGDVIAVNIGTSGDVGVCQGDSGGPLVRTAADGTLVAVGVASGFFTSSTDPNHNCSDIANDQFWYARMDAETDWILQEMQTQYSSKFTCKASADGTYERCAIGADCMSNCDCKDPTTYCRNSAVLDPNSPFQTGVDTCNVCADGTCNCIKGQCMVRPDDFDGGDLNGDASCTSM